ncbi:proline-rich protein 2-like [Moschus berezovskii]|uniref:proline-rich protein 2-like n=1 Tax=Moschus berezovskii TaxID=68408 RepID=UPI002444E4CC|nr:proline-rich protein 2-like [Moschus berezovskii]
MGDAGGLHSGRDRGREGAPTSKVARGLRAQTAASQRNRAWSKQAQQDGGSGGGKREPPHAGSRSPCDSGLKIPNTRNRGAGAPGIVRFPAPSSGSRTGRAARGWGRRVPASRPGGAGRCAGRRRPLAVAGEAASRPRAPRLRPASAPPSRGRAPLPGRAALPAGRTPAPGRRPRPPAGPRVRAAPGGRLGTRRETDGEPPGGPQCPRPRAAAWLLRTPNSAAPDCEPRWGRSRGTPRNGRACAGEDGSPPGPNGDPQQPTSRGPADRAAPSNGEGPPPDTGFPSRLW